MFTELCRVGKDTTLRYTPDGKAVCNVLLAYDIGYGKNKRTGWLEASLWEKRAESLSEYLVKGKPVYVVVDDLEVEAWENNGKHGAKLKGRIIDIKFVGESSGAAPQQTGSNTSQPGAGGFDSFDDGVPF